jgi:hypothetical protein
MLNNVEWGEYSLSELFEIQKTKGFNKDKLTTGSEYDYVTRTSQNNGILKETGFVNKSNINPAGIWSLGLLQMNFFYRPKPWYAGQFVRKIVPKMELSQKTILFFTTLLNKKRDELLSVLVRDVDKTFLNAKVNLPTINGQINFDFIENFITQLELERLRELSAYLSITGLENYTLNDEEKAELAALSDVKFGIFKIEKVLSWQKHISELNPLDLDSLSVSDEKKYPFYGQATINNGVIEYRNLNDDVLNNKLSKPTILIHSNNQNIVFLETPFYLKDGHGATSVLQSEELDNLNAQFIIGAIQKVISKKFAYNNKATKIALKNTEITLPIKSDNTPDYDYMSKVILATQKLVIKDVVLYSKQKIEVDNDIVARRAYNL